MLGELVLAPEPIKDNLILPPHQLKRLFQEVAPDWSSPSPFLGTVFKLLMPAHEAQSYQIPDFPEGFPVGSVVKNLSANAGGTRDVGSTPGSGRSPGEGNGNPLQCSCLGNPKNREAWLLQSMGLQRAGHNLATKQCLPDLFLTCSALVIPAFFAFHAHTNLLPQGLCTCCTSCLECPSPRSPYAGTYPSLDLSSDGTSQGKHSWLLHLWDPNADQSLLYFPILSSS